MTMVGIEKLMVWPGYCALPMESLVTARGGDVAQVRDELLISARSVCPPWEDPVTMAVEAGRRLLSEEDKARVRLLIVASESSPDQEKPLSAWVHRWLSLPDDVRHLEVKSACYAGSGALQLAAAWVASWPEPEGAALLITTDMSRPHFHKPWEFVMGAGAVAVLISKRPRFLALEPGLSGAHTQEVNDLFRPTSRVEAGHHETSLLSYLDGVERSYDGYRRAVKRLRGVSLETTTQLSEWAPHLIYHAPFGGLTHRAHRSLLRAHEDFDPTKVLKDFHTRVRPSLVFGRRMGGVYAGSIFVSLLGLASSGRVTPGERVGIYSYGSGSCAEFYSGVFGEDLMSHAASTLEALLDARQSLSVREYEEAERERIAWADTPDYMTSLDGAGGCFLSRVKGSKGLIFTGATGWVRQYEWS